MKPNQITTLFAVYLFGIANVRAGVLYVDVNSANPASPYTSWSTAAATIQDAVDAAAAGDQILVTNGVYQTGGEGTLDGGPTTNRVAVSKALEVKSVNGPQFTLIHGYQVPGTTNESGAIRCVYLTNGASLSGFTLTNGATWPNGRGGGVSGYSTNAVVTNCVLVGNSAGALGGGAYRATLFNCTLIGNTTGNNGQGGGANSAILNNCSLLRNTATSFGGGASSSTLRNCYLAGNTADRGGGGAAGSTLYNCTVTGNVASQGGGTIGGSMFNCISYFNTAQEGENYLRGDFLSCCTTPLPPGAGNIDADPQLATVSYLSAASPCLGAGSTAYVAGTDIDDEVWLNPPSIGCDEYHAGAVTGPLSVNIMATYTNVVPYYPVRLNAVIEGRATASVWDFQDGVSQTNHPYATHAWTAPGVYSVVLRAYNKSQPSGVNATSTVHVVHAAHYVSTESINPVSPFESWATAATNIQDAVDAAEVTGALVLVTNGIYANGGKAVAAADPSVGNRVAVTRPVSVRSVNGPQFTTIQGYQVPGTTNGDGAIRCVYLANDASLSGFTLTKGATTLGGSGGGVCCESATAGVSNCVIVGNSAGYLGGGGYKGTFNNCNLYANSASYGGGADGGTFYNCALVGNSARSFGGGVYRGLLNNCILYDNSAPSEANFHQYESLLRSCCTTPDPGGGASIITNAPLFVDQAAGNLRLQSNSPCINSGLNTYAPAGSDLDGNPRVAGGTVDIGAYEFQSPASLISYAWLQQYGLIPDATIDSTDSDGDGPNNWQEWIAGTVPIDASSALRLLSPASDVSGMTVSWQSVSSRSYWLERATNLGAMTPFSLVTSNIFGQPGLTIYTDSGAFGAGPYFYRVGVQQ